jgi:FkbM family methyltransferase
MRYYNLLRNISNWTLHLAVKFNLTRQDPLLFVTRRGVRIEVPRRLLHTFKEIFMEECYLKDLALPLPENPAIVDIGANAGYFSLQALSRFIGGRVFAFEPVPANFRLLMRNRDLNPGLPLVCVPKAVAGQSGELVLAFEGGEDFTTSATVLGGGDGQKGRICVPAVTLAEIMSDHDLQRIDLLKMDCEGAEYEILYRCPPEILARIGRIVMEVHTGPQKDQNIGALEDFLKQHGFATQQRPVGMLSARQGGKSDG